MTDIVERLREGIGADWQTAEEAADEIERLHQSLHDTVTQTQEQAAEIVRLAADYNAARDAHDRRAAEVVKLRAALLDGNRPLPFDRDTVGRMVREAWVRWAETQPAPKPSWLVPYDELSEADKEADRQIGESVARWTLIYDAARAALGEQA